MLRWLKLLSVYLRIVLGTITKPRWKQAVATLPDVSAFDERAHDGAMLARFMKLVHSPSGSVPPAGPGMFFLAQAFPIVLDCLSQLPFSVLGGVVNRRAVHTLHTGVKVMPGDKLLHSARVVRETRATASGHSEFDVLVRTTHIPSGQAVYEGQLTMVKLISGKRHRAPPPKPGDDGHFTPASQAAGPEAAIASEPAGAGAAGAAAGASGEVQPLLKADKVDAREADMSLSCHITLGASAGIRWALLDGDISPMHISTCSARLVGFKRTVANVSCVVAALEAQAQARGWAPRDAGPVVLSVEYKQPCLLPCHLEVWSRMLPAGPAGPTTTAKPGSSGSGQGRAFLLRVSKGGPVVMEGSLSWHNTTSST